MDKAKQLAFEDLKKRIGIVCKCGYHTQDTGNGHTADYWLHMAVAHPEVGTGVILEREDVSHETHE